MAYGYLSFREQGGWGHFFLLASKSLSEQPSTSQWAQPPCFWLWLRNIRQTTNATRAAMMTASRMDWMFIVVSIIIRYNPLENPLGKAVDTEGANPSDGGLPNHQPHGIPTAHLALHRGYGGHTGRIEQAEHQERNGRGGDQRTMDRRRGAEEHGERGHHTLLGHEAADDGRHDAPVVAAEGGEDGGYATGDGGKDAALLVVDKVEPEVERLQEPNHDGGHKDDSKGAVEKILVLSQISRSTLLAPGKR